LTKTETESKSIGAVTKPFFEKRKSELVKIELHVPRATFGNYEKLRQYMEHDSIETTILRLIDKEIKHKLGRFYVPVPKQLRSLLDAEARKKGVDFEDNVAEILNSHFKEG
jgi:hypothetical protein